MAEAAAFPWAQAAAASMPSLFNWWGTRQATQGMKRAGTTLANTYGQAAEDVWKLPGYVNPGIAQAYGTAGQDVQDQAFGSAGVLDDRTRQAQAGMDLAVTGANEFLDPYATGGTEAFHSLAEMGKVPTLTREELTYKPGELTMDPGYQFRLSEGSKALERSAAAKGRIQGGGMLKALTRYQQGVASDEWAKAYERGRREFADSFDRMIKGQAERRTTLAGLANYGYNASGQKGQNLQYGANYRGNLGVRGAETTGNWLNNAAQYKGNAGINSQLAQAGNVLNAGNRAIDYSLGGAGATAGSQAGVGQAWGQFWGNTGQNLSNFASGYPGNYGQPAVGGYNMGTGGVSPGAYAPPPIYQAPLPPPPVQYRPYDWDPEAP